MNLKEKKHIYFVGIKGVAMTALAIIAKEMGHNVSGSDVEDSFPTDATLSQFKIPFFIGFSADHISPNIDLVIYTGAHQGIGNNEVQAAQKKGIPTLPHGKALGLFMEGKKALSVAGSHGKTTTSALISHILSQSGYDPSFAVGCGQINSLGAPAHFGQGKYFVAEADEYVTDPTIDKTPRFMWQKPHALTITNIDFDHPDVYQNLEAVQNVFKDFITQKENEGIVIYNGDDRATNQVMQEVTQKKASYGKSTHVDYQLQNIKSGEGVTRFQVKIRQDVINFEIGIPGEHNAMNATAAIATLVEIGLPVEQIRDTLGSFKGTKRRFEKIIEKNEKLLYDDYAHHPKEIIATLSAAKSWFPHRRLIVVFQPHTFTRTYALLDEFARCFAGADIVLLTDIYASAREKPIPNVSSSLLLEKIQKNHSQATLASTVRNVLEYMSTKTRANDLILTMGAGDIYTWLPQIEAVL